MNPQPTQLDPQIVNLTKAIRQTESGGNFQAKGKSGEYGAYQFTEPTWNAQAQKYGVNVPLLKATPEQQNEVAYKQIAEWKAKGHNVGQIASMWNAGQGEPDAYLGKFSNGSPSVGVNKFGVKYSVPDYAKSVATAYQTLKQGGQVGVDPNNPSSISGTQYAPQENPSGAWFPSSPTDSPLAAGAKTIGNLIPSAFNFGKGVLDVLNPLSTLRKLGDIPQAFSEAKAANQGSVAKTLGNTATSLPRELVKAVVPEAGRQLLTGNLQGAQESITNDPVGQIAPFLLGAEGVAKFADSKLGGAEAQARKNYATNGKEAIINPKKGIYQNALDTGISNASGIATKPLGAVADLFTGVTKSAASHLTGLDSQTISQIISSPEAFGKLTQDQMSRGGLATEFGKAIDDLEGTLNDTGKAYEPIRAMQGLAAIPENFFMDVLSKFGLKLEQGTVLADTNSVTRSTSDITAIQKFITDWGNKTELTPNEYLNMRGDLAKLAKYDKLTGMGTTKSSQVVAHAMRDEANKTIRPQIPGLRELDAHATELYRQFNPIKKDFLTKDAGGNYVFKDNAVNKIANAAGAGKGNLLSRMEQIFPGITKRIQILKAVEDIEKAKENKIGAYAKGALTAFAATLNPAAIVAAIVTNPTIAVPLIRGLGWSAGKVGQVTSALKIIAGDLGTKAISSPYVRSTAIIGNTANTASNNVKK